VDVVEVKSCHNTQKLSSLRNAKGVNSNTCGIQNVWAICIFIDLIFV